LLFGKMAQVEVDRTGKGGMAEVLAHAQTSARKWHRHPYRSTQAYLYVLAHLARSQLMDNCEARYVRQQTAMDGLRGTTRTAPGSPITTKVPMLDRVTRAGLGHGQPYKVDKPTCMSCMSCAEPTQAYGTWRTGD